MKKGKFRAKLEDFIKDWDMLNAIARETPFISDYGLRHDLKPDRGDIIKVEGNVIHPEFKHKSSFKE